jgi:hypothetical protein
MFNLTSDKLMKLAMAGAACFALYKFGGAKLQTAAIAVAAVAIAKNAPVTSEVL